MKQKRHLILEHKLVYTNIHQRISNLYKEQGNSFVDIYGITISATERDLSNELLISRRLARQSCSALVKLGYLKLEKVGVRLNYGLTDKVLDTDLHMNVDVGKINNDIRSLLTHFNIVLKKINVPQDRRLQMENPFHIHFLVDLFDKLNNDIDKSKLIINQCADIFNYRFGHKSAQTLATRIKDTFNKPFTLNKVVSSVLNSKPDRFLLRRYRLRQKGIDIFLLDNPFDLDIETDDNQNYYYNH